MRALVGPFALVGLLGIFNACASAPTIDADSDESAIEGTSPSPPSSSTHPRAGGDAPSTVHEPLASLPTPRATGTNELCHLINGRGVDDPSPNNLQLRTNLKGTDL